MATEQTPLDRKRFVLLCDFWDAYKNFELKQTTSVPEIDGAIRPQIHMALSSAVDNLELMDLSQLRTKVRTLIPINKFVVTLDGGVIFNQYDFSLEITRACTSISHAEIGPYVRMPRALSAHLSQQFLNLKAQYEKSSCDGVVVCDDGIGTGGTIKRILTGLRDVGIRVELVVTVTNPNDLDLLEGVPIKSLRTPGEPYNWLNERDLFWGLPRSGLSVSEKFHFLGLGGFPYTINRDMVISRIGINPNKAEQFRQTCLTANITFWKLLERFHGRKLRLKDCARLSFLEERLGEDAEVINIISKSRTTDILRDYEWG